jgi:hypothetical protein
MFLTVLYSSDQTKKNHMVGSYGTYEGGRGHAGFWLGNLRQRQHFEHLGLEERVIIKRMFKKLDVKVWA